MRFLINYTWYLHVSGGPLFLSLFHDDHRNNIIYEVCAWATIGDTWKCAVRDEQLVRLGWPTWKLMIPISVGWWWSLIRNNRNHGRLDHLAVVAVLILHTKLWVMNWMDTDSDVLAVPSSLQRTATWLINDILMSQRSLLHIRISQSRDRVRLKRWIQVLCFCI